MFTEYNTKRKTIMTNPTPNQIKQARTAANLTQTQAAELIGMKLNAWQKWEQGVRKMHPSLYELFCIKNKLKT